MFQFPGVTMAHSKIQNPDIRMGSPDITPPRVTPRIRPDIQDGQSFLPARYQTRRRMRIAEARIRQKGGRHQDVPEYVWQTLEDLFVMAELYDTTLTPTELMDQARESFQRAKAAHPQKILNEWLHGHARYGYWTTIPMSQLIAYEDGVTDPDTMDIPPEALRNMHPPSPIRVKIELAEHTPLPDNQDHPSTSSWQPRNPREPSGPKTSTPNSPILHNLLTRTQPSPRSTREPHEEPSTRDTPPQVRAIPTRITQRVERITIHDHEPPSIPTFQVPHLQKETTSPTARVSKSHSPPRYSGPPQGFLPQPPRNRMRLGSYVWQPRQPQQFPNVRPRQHRETPPTQHRTGETSQPSFHRHQYGPSCYYPPPVHPPTHVVNPAMHYQHHAPYPYTTPPRMTNSPQGFTLGHSNNDPRPQDEWKTGPHAKGCLHIEW